MHALCLAAALAVAAGSAMAEAPRPATVEDLVRQEAFGAVRISPDGRWIVAERQAPWNTAATYRMGFFTHWLLSGLEIHSADGRTPVRTLRDPGGATGYVSGPIAPDGRRMVVYRLEDMTWRLGVMILETAEVAWLPITPETPRLGRTLAWRSPTELVAIVRPDHSLPLVLRYGAQLQDRTEALWDDAAGGHRPSSVFIPSGQRRDARPQGPLLRLSLIDVVSGKERPLADGEFFDLELSPDGRFVAALYNAEDLQGSADVLATQGEPTRRRRLILADLDTGQSREPLPDADYLSHLLAWSPDSRRLLAFTRPPGGTFADGAFWRLSFEGSPRRVSLGAASPWIDVSRDDIPVTRGGWDGDRDVVVQARSASGARVWLRSSDGEAQPAMEVREPSETIGLFAGRAVIARSDGLYRLDGTLASPGRSLGDGQSADGGDRAVINPPAGALGRHPVLDGEGCLFRRAEPAQRTCPAGLSPGAAPVAASSDAGRLVVRRRSSGGAVELRLLDASGARSLGSVNGMLDQRLWGEIRPVRHKGPDGQDVTSWLLLPPRRPGGSPPPLVAIVYPGADYASPPSWLRPGLEAKHINPGILAGAGYAVLAVSLPERAGNDPRTDLAARILAGVDAAAEGREIDGSRVALLGHSFGGYGALLAATQTDRFSAVIASNGYADLSRSIEPAPFWRVSPDDGVLIHPMSAWAETGQARIGAAFPNDPWAWAIRSPLYAAAGLTTPALLIESDLDGARMGALFSALYRLNREAALLTYFGEGHAYVSPANLRDLHAHILDWLDRYVRGSGGGQPLLPPAGPSLQAGEDQEAITRRVPDQARLVETGLDLRGIDDPVGDQ
jgi:dipeptidyl aminopeptidase/acylaminoacyl peptidase